jgi:hypothetical protein
MLADDIDYKYPIGYGRTVKVEDMVVDFSTVPNSKGISWLMRLSPFSQATSGGRVFFPSHLEFKNIVVEGRQQGMRLINIPSPQNFKLAKAGSYDGVQVHANCKMIFEDIHLEKLAAADAQSADQVHLSLRNSGENYKDEYALYPKIRIARCNEFSAHLGGNVVEMSADHCKVVRFTGSENGLMPGSLSFTNCKFEAVATDTGKPLFMVGAELGTNFTNCVVYAPRLNNVVRPDLVDRIGFIQLNKAVHYCHLNSRLGNDIINFQKRRGIKFNERFITMLKVHHEMESPLV